MQERVLTLKHRRHTGYCINLNRLPETFSIRDEQIGVWWVTMAARDLHRTRTIPGSWKEKHPKPDLVVPPTKDEIITETTWILLYGSEVLMFLQPHTSSGHCIVLLYSIQVKDKHVATFSSVPHCLLPPYLSLHQEILLATFWGHFL